MNSFLTIYYFILNLAKSKTGLQTKNLMPTVKHIGGSVVALHVQHIFLNLKFPDVVLVYKCMQLLHFLKQIHFHRFHPTLMLLFLFYTTVHILLSSPDLRSHVLV